MPGSVLAVDDDDDDDDGGDTSSPCRPRSRRTGGTGGDVRVRGGRPWHGPEGKIRPGCHGHGDARLVGIGAPAAIRAGDVPDRSAPAVVVTSRAGPQDAADAVKGGAGDRLFRPQVRRSSGAPTGRSAVRSRTCGGRPQAPPGTPPVSGASGTSASSFRKDKAPGGAGGPRDDVRETPCPGCR